MRASDAGQRVVDAPVELVDARGAAERPPDGLDDRRRGRLVERDDHRVGVDDPQVDAVGPGRRRDRAGAARHPGGDGVEGDVVEHVDRAGAQPGGEHDGEPVDAPRDPGEPLGTVVHGVEPGDDREEHLRGADVAGGTLAADVLLAGLEGEPERGAAGGVDGHADEPAGEAALVLVAGGEEPGVGSPEAEGHPEALGRADDDVGALLPRRDEQRAGEEVGRDGDERPAGVQRVDGRAPVADLPGGAGLLEQRREHAVGQALVGVADVDVEAERRGAGPHDGDRLRMGAGVDDERGAGLLVDPVAQRHRLGGGGRLVEQRRVRELHPGEVGDHRLEVQERLEAPLGDLGLVRGVRRVPRRVLEHVALDHRRRDGVGVPGAEQRDEHGVARRERRELVGDGRLVGRVGDRERPVVADAGRHGGAGELVERGQPERREHGRLLGGVGADVALDEAGGLEVSQGHGRSDGRVRGPGHRCDPSLPRCRGT